MVLSHSLVDCLKSVAVPIPEKGRVIGGAIFGPIPRRMLAIGPMGNSKPVKGVYCVPVRSIEGEMKSGTSGKFFGCLCFMKNCKLIRFALTAIACAVFCCPDTNISERLKDGIIKSGRNFKVPYPKGKVTQHTFHSFTSPCCWHV